METEENRKLAEQGNTDAKLYVPEEPQQEDEEDEDREEDPGEFQDDGGEAA